MKALKSKLNENFLYDLYACVLKYDSVCSLVMQHIDSPSLPSQEWQAIHKAIHSHYRRSKRAPAMSSLMQTLADNSASGVLTDISNVEYEGGIDDIVSTFEYFVKAVKLKDVYKKIGDLYNQNEQDKAQDLMVEYVKWLSGFSADDVNLVDVAATFVDRFNENKEKEKEMKDSGVAPVTRFYIDKLDELNGGRSLRTQLTCILSSTGVGKSHAARHIGSSACRDGFHVLHFQLEGSEEEALDAYSGALVGRSSYDYEKGRFSEDQLRILQEDVLACSGSLVVRSFPRFNNQVSTIDIQNGITSYRKKYNRQPDIVIVDSLDLLTDSSGKRYDSAGERSKRIAVANDLKDLAGDENVWLVATYQATIENRDWLNDEKNVLTEYNCAEAKGLARPCTHLISLNRSDAEREEQTMRIFVAKSRFFDHRQPIKIATDYGNEVFFHRSRTMSIGG